MTNTTRESPPSKKVKASKSSECLSTIHDEHAAHSPNWSVNLPYEILLTIFEYYAMSASGDVNKINDLKKVCKSWSRVADDPKLWRHLNVYSLMPCNLVTTQSPVKASSSSSQSSPSKANHRKLQELTNKFNVQLKRAIKSNMCKLRFIVKLNLSHLVYMTCDDLELLLSNCNGQVLRELNVSHCKRISVSKTSQALNNSTESGSECFERVIGKYCPFLCNLDMSNLDVGFVSYITSGKFHIIKVPRVIKLHAQTNCLHFDIFYRWLDPNFVKMKKK
jgi:hypothetical protein